MDIRQLAPLAGERAALLPPDRAAKMKAFLRPDDSLRCLAGWLLMARFLGPRLEERLRYGRYGKPGLPGGPYFNLAHSGDYAVLGVSAAPLGVDIEQRRTEDDCLTLAARALHPDELDCFRREPTARNFFDLWVLKESYMKLVGTGLMLEPNSFALLSDRQGTRLPDRPEIRFCLYGDVLPGYSLAMCIKGKEAPRTVTQVSV